MEHSFWRDWPARISRDEFRREGDYLSQGADVYPYERTYEYVKSIDRLGLLDRLTEDRAFGVVAHEMADGRLVSRDLLDSIIEITYLKELIGPMLRYANVLDIGAGYGRFAHRFATAFPRSNVYCTDAVLLSLELCRAYLEYRGVGDRCPVIMLDQVSVAAPFGFDLAVNIHSWSECTLSSITEWLDLLARLRVRYLFVVPHTPECWTWERDGNNVCFLPAIKEAGYELLHSRPKYGDFGIPDTTYFLFERRV